MNSQPPRILIVEDDPATRFLLRTFLSSLGELTICEDGAEAWQYLFSGKPADLLVTDHEMPNLSGKDLISKIRSSELDFKNIPVIMVTASITREEMTGVDLQGFYEKPITQTELIAAARSALGS